MISQSEINAALTDMDAPTSKALVERLMRESIARRKGVKKIDEGVQLPLDQQVTRREMPLVGACSQKEAADDVVSLRLGDRARRQQDADKSDLAVRRVEVCLSDRGAIQLALIIGFAVVTFVVAHAAL